MISSVEKNKMGQSAIDLKRRKTEHGTYQCPNHTTRFGKSARFWTQIFLT